MANFNLVPGVEKLMDYLAIGVASIAGPATAPWRAKQNAKARRIEAQAEADILQINAEAHAKAIYPHIAQDEEGQRVIATGEDKFRELSSSLHHLLAFPRGPVGHDAPHGSIQRGQ